MADNYEPITPSFDFSSLFPDGKDEQGQSWVMPSEEVAKIVLKLFGSTPVRIGERSEQSISADRIADDDLEVLNRFIATISGRDDCQLVAVYGCCGEGCFKLFGKEKESIACGNRFVTSCGSHCVPCCIG